jgi:MFS family permease
MAAILLIITAISAVPSPLYAFYQQEWNFADSVLTEVFAVYVLALLVSLLIFGSLSDHVGRRPVLLAAIAVEAVSLGVFLISDSVELIGVARVVQGLATGVALPTLGAVLIDLQPPGHPKLSGVVNSVGPPAGLAIGALSSGLLVQVAPWPSSLVFLVFLGLLALAAVVVWRTPETSPRKPGALQSLRPRVGLPAHLRTDFLGIAPIMVASWSLCGLYMSLGPSVASEFFAHTSYLTGGLVVSALCGTGAVTVYVLRDREPRSLIRMAAAWFIVGILVTLAGVEFEIGLLALLGTLIAGVGFGGAALGSFGVLVTMPRPDERGELFAFAFVVSYLAFSLPAVLGGFASDGFGLHGTAMVYGASVLVVSVVAFFAAHARRRSEGAAIGAES